MNLATWLDAERGRSVSMARHFNRSKAAVSIWRVKGVPRQLMKAIRDFTGGAVTLEELVPDSEAAAAQEA